MIHSRLLVSGLLVVVALAASTLAAPVSQPVAQVAAQAPNLTVEVTPAVLTLRLGERATLKAVVKDAAGRDVAGATVVFTSSNRRQLSVTPEGVVQAMEPGTYTVTAIAVPAGADASAARGRRGGGAGPNRTTVTITVPEPPIRSITFVRAPSRFYAGTFVPLQFEVVDEANRPRPDEPLEFTSSNAVVATVDALGQLRLLAPGTATIVAKAGSATGTLAVTVGSNPVARLELSRPAETARTGDVLAFAATARDASGRVVTDVPIHFAVLGHTVSTIRGAGASAHMERDGRFVAENPGRYTIVATSGAHTAMQTVSITQRQVRRAVTLVGRGPVLDRHTSDIWVWQGLDGKDYAVTGTWGADGHAFFWDVSNPAQPEKVGEVQVDARTVNDVKVSSDGRFAILSREGASNRRNGLVIVDVTNPRAGLPILARFDDELTGGVHNTFVYNGHVFALSAGQRYDIINVEDPTKPTRVGRFELDTPSHSIHDVWVAEGVAFSANWANGLVAVDVGGGGKGGSPANPVMLGQYKYPSGWNHAVYPYKSKSTGKFYVFAGDETFPEGVQSQPGGMPNRPGGWIHVVDWSDWSNPREVARYQVPEAGTHNLWVEDDIMYVGYYQGGLRVVDVSGELLGDLYRQGREIARYLSDDPKGVIANNAMVWGPQPYKGNVFFSDYNSGLWVVRLGDPVPLRRGEGER